MGPSGLGSLQSVISVLWFSVIVSMVRDAICLSVGIHL